ncbi:hypothetical protein JCM10908_007258 [Rhodotorula pacifica]|uniref:uncharacterized protein n=1 Tax=Rhodotorula pacifica TaxID=1495444 RepID=UPI0031785FB4
MESPFRGAVAHISSSKAPSDTQTKLQLYALYKIATVSSRPVAGSRPGMLDFTGRAKWDAWDRLGAEEGMNPEEAQRRYVLLAEDKFGFRRQAETPGDSSAADEGAQRTPAQAQPKQERMVGVSMLASDFVDEAPPSKLHELAIDGNAQKLERFLASDESRASDLNARDSYGYTALHLATDRGHAAAVKTLLAAGADKSIPDEDGNTALDLARLAEHEEIVGLLGA